MMHLLISYMLSYYSSYIFLMIIIIHESVYLDSIIYSVLMVLLIWSLGLSNIFGAPIPNVGCRCNCTCTCPRVMYNEWLLRRYGFVTKPILRIHFPLLLQSWIYLTLYILYSQKNLIIDDQEKTILLSKLIVPAFTRLKKLD